MKGNEPGGMTIDQFAKTEKVSKRTVQRWINRDYLDFKRLPNDRVLIFGYKIKQVPVEGNDGRVAAAAAELEGELAKLKGEEGDILRIEETQGRGGVSQDVAGVTEEAEIVRNLPGMVTRRDKTGTDDDKDDKLRQGDKERQTGGNDTVTKGDKTGTEEVSIVVKKDDKMRHEEKGDTVTKGDKTGTGVTVTKRDSDMVTKKDTGKAPGLLDDLI